MSCRAASRDDAPPALTEAEAAAVEARVKAFEARAGVQVVVAVVERSDVYHGLRWRAFAAASALAGLGVVLADELWPAWPEAHTVLFAMALTLGAGATAALAATLVPGFARLFLNALRAGAEVQRQAQAMFLQRELFATRGRDALLILASRFERRAAVHADRRLRDRVPDEAWEAVTARMRPLLAACRTADALLAGLDAADAVLADHPVAPGAGGANELPAQLPDRPIQSGGA